MADTITKSKLVVKDLGNSKAVLAKPEGDKTPHVMGHIMGIARRVASKVAMNGDIHEQIVGEFEGVNHETGEVFDSGILYLPSGIHERLAEPLKKEDADPIEFAIEVSTVRSTNAAGFEYRVRSLIKTAIADPLSKLREQVAASAQAKLAAPTPEVKPEVKADPKHDDKAGKGGKAA